MRPIEISLATKSSSLYFWIISSSEQTPSSSSFLTYVSAEIFYLALRMYVYYSVSAPEVIMPSTLLGYLVPNKVTA